MASAESKSWTEPMSGVYVPGEVFGRLRVVPEAGFPGNRGHTDTGLLLSNPMKCRAWADRHRLSPRVSLGYGDRVTRMIAAEQRRTWQAGAVHFGG